MNCKEAKELFSPLIDKELSLQEQENVLAHIAECHLCREEYEKLIEIKKQFAALRRDCSPNGKLAEAVMSTVNAQKPKKKSFNFRYVSTVAAALIVVLLIAYSGLKMPNNESSKSDISAEKEEYILMDIVTPDGNTELKTDTVNESAATEKEAPADIFTEGSGSNTVIFTSPNFTDETKMHESAAMPSSPEAVLPEAAEDSSSEQIEGIQMYSDEFVTHFMIKNSISPSTSLIYVESDTETVAPLFEAVSISGNFVTVSEPFDTILKTLTYNSISVAYTHTTDDEAVTIIVTEE